MLIEARSGLSPLSRDRFGWWSEVEKEGGAFCTICWADDTRFRQHGRRLFQGVAAEAKMLDPQQRLLLEMAWTGLEDAGVERESLKSKAVGVFVGISTSTTAR